MSNPGDKESGRKTIESEDKEERPAQSLRTAASLDEHDEDEEGLDEENAIPVINPEDELDEIYNRASSDEGAEGPVAEPEETSTKTPQAKRARSRGVVSSARQLLLEQVQERAQNANDKLKLHLAGSLLVEVLDKNEKYLLNWKDQLPTVSELQKDGLQDCDCSLKIRESDLLRIANGELNPQVAMLSDKIQGRGKLGLAVYFFNLIVSNYE